MAIADFLGYEEYIRYMDSQLEIWGQPISVYTHSRQIALGYEDTTESEIVKMDSDKVLGNKFTRTETRGWINFTIDKSVFYRFNWFPEDGEELCMAVFDSDSLIKENDYIRTAIPESTSIWGDMIFQVRAIKDKGLANVLQRFYFLKPTNNADLHCELDF